MLKMPDRPTWRQRFFVRRRVHGDLLWLWLLLAAVVAVLFSVIGFVLGLAASKRLLPLILALAAFGCAGRKTRSGHMLPIPAHCINITRFDKPCKPDGQGGYVCNGVHYKIRQDIEECPQYDTANIVTVKR